jgi:O-methyltransferase
MNRTYQKSSFERVARRWYVHWLRPHLSNSLHRQRFKLLWFFWGYVPIVFIRNLPIFLRLSLIIRFLRIDWNVLHAHRPCEIAHICRALAERHAATGEVMIEAGCYQGGSSAKFSIVCEALGYRLQIHDSFEGVEPLSEEEKLHGHDFSGEYAAPEALVRSNLGQYGRLEICTLRKGWFSETLAAKPVLKPIRLVYIDCDSSKGTAEVLRGVVPTLVADGLVFSQDFQIEGVRKLLLESSTWTDFGRGIPKIEWLCGNLAVISFRDAVSTGV